MWLKCATFLLLAFIANAYAGDFTGYQLLRISPKTKQQIDLVGSWQHNTDFDIWSTDATHIDVLLSPIAFESYRILLDLNEVNYQIINRNIQKTLDEETRSIEVQKALLKSTGQEGRVVNTFARHADINTWMDQQAAANPSFLSTYSSGKSYEGRDMRIIKFTSSKAGAKAVWFDCGIHAREWISPATCVYIIDALIRERAAGVQTVLNVLDKYDIYVLPVVNPDGYEYSQTSSANRLWRKNRRINAGSTCVGVDLNRNYGYQWMVAGASSNPCSDTYAGPVQDSEPETIAVEDEIRKRNDWDTFFTIHTYGLYWFTPWGYTSALPADYSDLVARINVGAAAAKAVYGSTFAVGSSTVLLYAAAGGSDDWAKGVANIKFSHCLELRPGNTGIDANYGFTLPVDRAPKAGEETFRGVIAFLNV